MSRDDGFTASALEGASLAPSVRREETGVLVLDFGAINPDKCPKPWLCDEAQTCVGKCVIRTDGATPKSSEAGE
jgi:hypothetical protein